jgi:hypothetical protein
VIARTYFELLRRSRQLHTLLAQLHALEGAVLLELREIDRLVHETELGHGTAGEPGRPTSRPSLETAFKILLERGRNGRVGVHELARRTGTSWRQVQRVLEGDYGPSSQNRPGSSRNPES